MGEQILEDKDVSLTAGDLRGEDYKPLSENDLNEMEAAVYELLTEVGMEVNSEKALQIFEENGADVDRTENRVRLSKKIIEDALDKNPSEITLYGREEKHNLDLRENKVYFGTGGTVLNVLDLKTGQKRKINIQDVADISRLVDYLEHIDFLVIPVYPQECEDEDVDINRFYHSLNNTTKHVMGGMYSHSGIDEVIDMATKIAGSREALEKEPFISFITCVMSPLVMDETYTEFLIHVAEENLPVAIPAEPLAGATGPVTIAGNIVLMAAESIAGIVLAQMVNPGTPALFASTASALDMKQALYITGEIEMGLMHAGLAQLAQHFELPLYSTAGMSDAKIPDIQSGYESAMTNLLAGLAGANFIHDAAGLLEMCQTVAYEKYVVDNEIIGMAKRAINGIEVNDETMAVDVIKRIGPGGEYLTDMHTYNHMKTEYFHPEVSDRNPREKWEEEGSKETRERAREIAGNVLDSYQPEGVNNQMFLQLQDDFDNIISADRRG